METHPEIIFNVTISLKICQQIIQNIKVLEFLDRKTNNISLDLYLMHIEFKNMKKIMM